MKNVNIKKIRNANMTKEQIISAAIQIIKEEADKRGLKVIDKGTGHTFENTFWNKVIKDKSGIPNIVARTEPYDEKDKNKYRIELRSFWGDPEIDIYDGYSLMILTYSNIYIDDEGKLNDYGDNYRVYQVRVESYEYKIRLKEVRILMKRIRKLCRKNKRKEQKKGE